MKNQQFSLLMSEVAQLVRGVTMPVRVGEALVCTYDGLQCRIENGACVGLGGQIIVLVTLDQLIDERGALKLNSHFELTKDGYIAMLSDTEQFYVRHRSMPTHPQQVLDLLSQTVSFMRQLRVELKTLCG